MWHPKHCNCPDCWYGRGCVTVDRNGVPIPLFNEDVRCSHCGAVWGKLHKENCVSKGKDLVRLKHCGVK